MRSGYPRGDRRLGQHDGRDGTRRQATETAPVHVLFISAAEFFQPIIIETGISLTCQNRR